MEIAYLTSEYPARSHTFIRREIEIMREQGFKLHAFSLHRCAKSEILNEQEQQVYDDTWSVFPINLKDFLASHIACFTRSPANYFRALRVGFKFSGDSVKGFLYTFFYFAEAMYLAEQLKEKEVKAIHVHFANSGAKVAMVASKYLQVPLMLSLHGTVDFEYPGILWLKNMVQFADSVRCVSDYGSSQAKRLVKRSEYKKVFVSYCGLPSNYQNIKTNATYQHNPPIRLLSVGRLSTEKGQIILIEAASILKRRGFEFVLDIVGDGPDREMLEEESCQLGLQDLIRFHGAVEEKVALDYMRKAGILICSSFMEGLPQVLMESMLVNTPVIAPYIAGIPELIANRKTGLLFPAGNVTALADSIIELTNNEALYNEVMQAGRQIVLDRFMIDKTVVPLVARTRVLLSQY